MIVPITEDLSELPDATEFPAYGEELDGLSALPAPPSPTRGGGPIKGAGSRRSSRRGSQAPSLPAVASRRSSRAPSLPAADFATPARSKVNFAPPATVPAKLAGRAFEFDAGPLSDPAMAVGFEEEPTMSGALDVESLLDDALPAVYTNGNGNEGHVGRTYGGDFEFGDSSVIQEHE